MKINGYYSYPDHIDIRGSIKSNELLRFGQKTIAEIWNRDIDTGIMDSINNLAEDVSAGKKILFGTKKFDSLKQVIKEKLEIYEIEYFSPETIKLTLDKIKGYSINNINNVLAPRKVIEYLPSLSSQIIPHDLIIALKTIDKNFPFIVTDMYEDVVYAVFYYAFDRRVIQWGNKSKFKREPDGLVIIDNYQYSFLYDCKSANDSYNMTSSDENTLVSYVRNKKIMVENKFNTSIRYYLIISPKFKGDLLLRKQEFYKQTGVSLVFMTSTILKKLANWIITKDKPNKSFIDWQNLFTEVEVSNSLTDGFIEQTDNNWSNK